MWFEDKATGYVEAGFGDGVGRGCNPTGNRPRARTATATVHGCRQVEGRDKTRPNKSQMMSLQAFSCRPVLGTSACDILSADSVIQIVCVPETFR